MKKITIYTRLHIIEGDFDYSGNILSYINRFDNIRIKPRKIDSAAVQTSPAELEESSEPLNFHPQNIFFIRLEE